ncbi:MAG: hypothetical protein CBC38_07960 [Gammaproteobacteria bacterium TMED78]|nr:MAG: hypothetical protein CBC38_07960 [Gammaproteobacteria bacterium TMED78]|tara:strand:+ start:29903 stop:31030 length:1128 start_codon:yes stop_codon:yes gene_type:complete
MKKLFIKIFILQALTLFHGNALTHHSFAATFSTDEKNTVDGIIKEFRFINPHVLITLDVANDDGSITEWVVEGSSATGWRRNGWSRDSLNTGDKLRINGSATLDGSPMISIDEMFVLNPENNEVLAKLSPQEDPKLSLGNAIESVPPDSEKYFLPPYLTSGEPNFTGTTMSTPTGGPRGGPDITNYDPPMPYNSLGNQVNTSEPWNIINDPQVFCDPPGVVRQAGYTPYGQIIRQYPDHITIEYEEYGSRRAIFLGNELPRPGVKSHLGDSVARYEGDMLIIETVNLLPNHSGHRGRPLSDEARVIERYTKRDDPDRGTLLMTETTVYDPLFLTEPWTINRIKLYQQDYDFIENSCEPPLRERPKNVWQETEWNF